MLEHLFGSRTRTKLLHLFLSNPDQAYFIRELTRRIDTQINSVRRELKNLLDSGILRELPQEEVDRAIEQNKKADVVIDDEADDETTASDRQMKKFFQADKGFPLFKELQALFVKSPLLLKQRLLNEMSELGDVSYIAMTGYFVGDPENRVDLIAIGDINKPKLQKIVTDFEKEIEREINYTVMTLEEWKYRRSITDKFIFNLMEMKKIDVVNRLVNQ